MNWTKKEEIADSVVKMQRMNMDLRPGERVLIVTDVPSLTDWQSRRQPALEDMVERSVLARLVAEVTAEQFPQSVVEFLPFPATGSDGAEPDEAVASRMKAAQVVIALTTYSMSHTNARQGATRAGARVASLPGFEARMFDVGGPMSVDYRQIAVNCQQFAGMLTTARQVTIKSSYGTELHFSIEGRKGLAEDGQFTQPGRWGNLPAGEAYIAPLEGTGEGQVVVLPGWYPGVTDRLIVRLARGEVVSIECGGSAGDELRRLLQPGNDDPVYKARRNLAELGIGMNPGARQPENVLEGEKIKGTVHVAVGDNLHIGGQVESDSHLDFVLPFPDLVLDGRKVIDSGEWRI